MELEDSIICPICERNVPNVYSSKHHLIPKSKKGKETALLCVSCHSTIHRTFHNKELAKTLNTIEALKSDPKMQTWIEWIQKRPTKFKINMKGTKKT